MDISGSGLNRPVEFYQKNTGNNINYAIGGENHLYTSNVFKQDLPVQNAAFHFVKTKKKTKNKRLNTIDSDYLPDETEEETVKNNGENFFISKEKPNFFERAKKTAKYIVSSTPLINYFFLKGKEKNIKNTVNTLNDISQNVDELMNTAVPYGEENILYDDIAKNLTKAANIISESNKNKF